MRSHRSSLTYAELDRLSDRLAAWLRPFVRPDSVVALLLPRTESEFAIAQLAVLKAGAAYACLDAAFPDRQEAEILADSESRILLTDATGVARAAWTGVRSLDCRRLLEEATVDSTNTPTLLPSNLAYLIYTSGTTGRPKGVMIEHASIVNLVESDRDEFHLGPDDRVAQGSSAAYDSSVEELWLAWGSGATAVVMDDEAARLGPDLVPWLQQERITVLCPPPTLLRTTGAGFCYNIGRLAAAGATIVFVILPVPDLRHALLWTGGSLGADGEDEDGCVWPKDVNFSLQCAKGHALAPLDGCCRVGGGPRLM
jgi:non-ribosomal peptide synthetase component F